MSGSIEEGLQKLNLAKKELVELEENKQNMKKQIEELNERLTKNNQQVQQFVEIKNILVEILNENKIELPNCLQENPQKQVEVQKPQKKTYEGKLNMEIVTNIFKDAAELAKDKYCDFITKNKSERRDAKNSNVDKYLDLIIVYVSESDNILKESADQLLLKNSYTENDLEAFLQQLYQSGQYQKFAELQLETSKIIKGRLSQNSSVSLDTPKIKEIFKYQITSFKDNEDIFVKLFQKFEQNKEILQKGPQIVPLAFDQILNDFVFEKFQVDQEDLDKLLNPDSFMEDKEFQIILMEMQTEMQKFMMKQGFGGYGGQDMGYY